MRGGQDPQRPSGVGILQQASVIRAGPLRLRCAQGSVYSLRPLISDLPRGLGFHPRPGTHSATSGRSGKGHSDQSLQAVAFPTRKVSGPCWAVLPAGPSAEVFVCSLLGGCLASLGQ